jgi:hypothetical protein
MKSTRLLSFVTPSNLIAAIVLFCLPWIEVRCNYTRDTGFFTIKDGQQITKYEEGDIVVLIQSGLQAAAGGYNDKVAPNPFRPPDPSQKALQKPPEPMPLLVVYGTLLFIGTIAGLVRKAGRLRSSSLVLCSSAAFLVLLFQAQRGFTIENSLPVENAALKKQFEESQKRGQSRMTEGPPVLNVYFTRWYYASFFFTPFATFTAVLEWGLQSRRKTLPAKETGTPS